MLLPSAAGPGVGFVGELSKQPSRRCVTDALKMLERMTHRGACGCEENTGDGAGILAAMPDGFFGTIMEAAGVRLPPAGQYAVGQVFLPKDQQQRDIAKRVMEAVAADLGHEVLAWRSVPTDNRSLGASAVKVEPAVEQWFVTADGAKHRQLDAEGQLYVLRKLIEAEWSAQGLGYDDAYFCSLSSRTIIYKGQLTPAQVPSYFKDLQHPEFRSYMAIVHSRFSTNTFPSWGRAQPMRTMAHNGEINTLRGNRNWMRSREGVMACEGLGLDKETLQKLTPIVPAWQSDSGSMDGLLELLTRCGRDVAEVMMMLIPEAWQNDKLMDESRRDFYRYHAAIMEPWDGPALVTFTDGRYLGATLDRNGLRPGRYYITSGGRVVMASEVGVVDIPPADVVRKGRLMPGNIFLVDFDEHRVVEDRELKERYSKAKPYNEWVKAAVSMEDIFATVPPEQRERRLLALGAESTANGNGNGHVGALPTNGNGNGKVSAANKEIAPIMALLEPLKAFGYSREALEMLIAPMAKTGAEALGSMGNDAALTAMSSRPRQPFEYFKQLFAQVTNPAIDPFREAIVTSLRCFVGPEGDITTSLPTHARRLELEQPVLTIEECEALKNVSVNDWASRVIYTTWPVAEGPAGMRAALEGICAQAEAAVDAGCAFLVLSDRTFSAERAAVPSLLAVGAVHHRLTDAKKRSRVGLIVETAEVGGVRARG
ncbi:glutamate synthase (NADPH/NADH) [Monoraphidium neglectum]|uniref:glutamate synthase (ferredoxin) n=1 Tax=Monoraphidium neglectum TaxID=145388 RepID=A0A0D2L3Z0_9CHLO|nr:glutamate synthase (NADPH/NADH) [Monoraphidium neglectum]KIZ01899.1 glutamate synthase (NADPH/NADH) [Monoraphidium neglectum]|eukprot:XP_013900918.1 glutamate synthase (NADPH/NADH) [Monoraphidium neglectum]